MWMRSIPLIEMKNMMVGHDIDTNLVGRAGGRKAVIDVLNVIGKAHFHRWVS